MPNRLLPKGSTSLVALAGVWILACALFLGIRNYEEPLTYGPHGRIFADNDGSMRWLLVSRALNGEGTRIRWMNEDNAPHGRINEWTSPLTLIGAWSTWLLHKIGGMQLKEAWGLTGVWMGAWIGLVIITAASLYAWRMGSGWTLAAVWLLALQPLPDWIQMTRLGNPDYHSLHQLLFLAMLLSTYRSVAQLRKNNWNAREVRFHAVVVGLAGAVAIWSGATECMFLVALIYALGVYEFWAEPVVAYARRQWQSSSQGNKGKKRIVTNSKSNDGVVGRPWNKPSEEVICFWLTCARVMTAGLLVAHLYEYWPNLWTTHLEMLSPWHVVGTLAVWICFEIRARFSSLAAAIIPVSISIVLLILLAAWIKNWEWTNLHVAQNNYYWLTWSIAAESQGWWHGDAALVGLMKRLWWCYGLLIPLFLVVAWKYIRSEKVAVWSCLVVAALFYLSLNQARWGSFFVIAFVLVVGLALDQTWPKISHWHWLVVVALCFPCWQTVYSGMIKNQSVKGRYEEASLMQKVSEIITQDAERKGAIVLAPWHLTPRMICHGQVRTIGSAYWSNMEGLKVSHEIYSTRSEERLRALLKEREVDYFLASPPAWMAKEIYEATLVLTGKSLQRSAVESAAILRVLRNQASFLEPLDVNLEGGWMLFKINREKL